LIFARKKFKKEYEVALLKIGGQNRSTLSFEEFVKVLTVMRYISVSCMENETFEKSLLLELWSTVASGTIVDIL